MRLLLLIVLLIVALVAQAPAWLLASRVRDASSAHADLRNASGTAWNGAADLVLLSSLPSPHELGAGRIEWSVRSVDPAGRSITVELTQQQSAPGGALKPLIVTAAAADRIDVAGSIRVPVQALRLVPMLNGWTAAGDAIAEITRIERAGGIANGSAAIRWTGARLVPPDLPGGLALGDATVNVTLAGGATTIQVRNTGGDVDVAINAASRSRTIAVTLQPRPSASPALLAWLQSHTMGRTPSGGFRIDAGWP